MEQSKILAQFALFAGLQPDQAQAWSGMADVIGQAITQRLRDPADASDPRLVLLAAAQLYEQYLAHSGAGLTQYKVGDIQVSQNTAAQTLGARQLLTYATELTAPLLLPPQDFVFAQM